MTRYTMRVNPERAVERIWKRYLQHLCNVLCTWRVTRIAGSLAWGKPGTASHFSAEIAEKRRQSLVCRVVHFQRIYGEQLFPGLRNPTSPLDNLPIERAHEVHRCCAEHGNAETCRQVRLNPYSGKCTTREYVGERPQMAVPPD